MNHPQWYNKTLEDVQAVEPQTVFRNTATKTGPRYWALVTADHTAWWGPFVDDVTQRKQPAHRCAPVAGLLNRSACCRAALHRLL